MLAEKTVTSVELVESSLARITARKELNAFISLMAEQALKAAEAADRELTAGTARPLTGIPLAVKDNICLRGAPTTGGSKMLSGFIPPYDATVIDKLQAAGAIVIGKTNMDEFGMGSSNENSFYGPVKNPHDVTRTPGGSSGGSAAAVADCHVPAALGSDTGGSVRQPAAMCGVVGLKPTYGSVSRYGLVAFASSLDQIGVLTRTVADCALVFAAICGYDEHDATSSDFEHPDYYATLGKNSANLKIGVPAEYFSEGLDPDVGDTVRGAIEELAMAGHQLVNISLRHTRHAIACYYVIADAEASSNLARYDGVRYGFRAADVADLLSMYHNTRSEGFGDEVKRRILLGTYVLSAGYCEKYYGRAQKVQAKITTEFGAAFEKVDVIISPTSPTVAFRLGEKVADPLAMYLSDVYTVPVNLAGLPAISVPCGTVDGLPVGLQIIGPRFSEELILSLAAEVERLNRA